MSGGRVAVLVCTTFFVVVSSILLVACCRSGTFSTGVVAAGAAEGCYGEFVNTKFFRDNEVACVARVYNGSEVGGWVEVGN